MEVEGQRNDPVRNSPKSNYKYNYHELYKNTRENNDLKGSWKKKFVTQLNAKSKQDRFQKAAATRNNFQVPYITDIQTTHFHRTQLKLFVNW
jgi:hypothetical protein